MIRIGNKTYPNSLSSILADSKLAPVFEQFAKKAIIEENLNFYRDSSRSLDSRYLYKTYIAEGAEEQINITSDKLATAKRLADANDWTSDDWARLIDACRVEVNRLLTDHNLSKAGDSSFWKSDIFWAHHESTGGQRGDASVEVDDAPGGRALWNGDQAAYALGLNHPALLQAFLNAYRSQGLNNKTLAAMQAYLSKEGKSWKPLEFIKLL
ncbi:hypothetical protein [Roseibium sp. RKSG952]|uniref:hypothetical protein n=1 Tax=Roseibium sp. RKSG952 TaxID=2529384 RepID=UPI0012BD1593|nr:hypothetical protein [Roseibium sp. RKSG952]